MNKQDKNIILGVCIIVGTPIIVTAVLLFLQAVK